MKTNYSYSLTKINLIQSPAAIAAIKNYLDTHQNESVCIRELWRYALRYPIGTFPERKQSLEIAEIIRSLGWETFCLQRFPEFGKQSAFIYCGSLPSYDTEPPALAAPPIARQPQPQPQPQPVLQNNIYYTQQPYSQSTNQINQISQIDMHGLTALAESLINAATTLRALMITQTGGTNNGKGK